MLIFYYNCKFSMILYSNYKLNIYADFSNITIFVNFGQQLQHIFTFSSFKL